MKRRPRPAPAEAMPVELREFVERDWPNDRPGLGPFDHGEYADVGTDWQWARARWQRARGDWFREHGGYRGSGRPRNASA